MKFMVLMGLHLSIIRHLNCYIDRVLRERLEDYAEEKGQTLTMAVERLLTKALDAEEKKEDN